MSRLSRSIRNYIGKLSSGYDDKTYQSADASLQSDMNLSVEGVGAQDLEGDGACDYRVSRSRSYHMLTHKQDMIIGESIRIMGCFEEGHIEKTTGLLEAVGLPVRRDIFVDIGANIGTHALFALGMGFKGALCIEPDILNFKLLRINQILNGLDARCFNINVAASDGSGHAQMEVSPDNFGDNRVFVSESDAPSLHDEGQWARRPIITDTIDNILSKNSIHINDIGLIWVDTQGHEGHVFSGGGQLLKSSAPVVCEFWPYGLQRSQGYEKLRSALRASGRTVCDLRASLTEGALVKLDLDDLDALFVQFLQGEAHDASPHTDLLLISNQKSPII